MRFGTLTEGLAGVLVGREGHPPRMDDSAAGSGPVQIRTLIAYIDVH
jgi:hypothetical protein